MTRILFLLLVFLSPLIAAEPQEPDLSGHWTRSTGAVLEARRGPDSTWSFFLVKSAPDAKDGPSMGTEVVSGLRWERRGGLWTRGTVHVPRGKETMHLPAELQMVEPGTLELSIAVVLSTRKDTLQRVPPTSLR